MTPRIKKVIKWSLVIVGLFLIFWIARAGYYGYQGYKWRKQTQAFEDALTKPLREDTYGGKTPEETWAMFLDALKKGDADMASKYFIVDKQRAWKNTILNTAKADRLDIVVKNLPEKLVKDGNNIVSTESYYHYEFIDIKTNQKRNNSVVFTFNPYSRIWKLSFL